MPFYLIKRRCERIPEGYFGFSLWGILGIIIIIWENLALILSESLRTILHWAGMNHFHWFGGNPEWTKNGDLAKSCSEPWANILTFTQSESLRADGKNEPQFGILHHLVVNQDLIFNVLDEWTISVDLAYTMSEP